MRAFMRSCTVALLFAMGVGMGASSAHAQESHYVILFAFDGTPRAPRVSHTFAVFAKSDGATGSDAGNVQAFPISWSTARPVQRGLLLRRPDPGVNLDLPQTFQVAADMNAQVTAFGPYQIKKDLYDRAVEQHQLLNSGAVSYKMLNGPARPRNAINCIHAVSNIVPGPELNTGTAFGVDATAMVRNHMSPWFVGSNGNHAWLIDRLGLGDAPIRFMMENGPPPKRK